MTYELYIDVFFLTEFFHNLLALILAAAMGRRSLRLPRLCLAAALGSLWSIFMLLGPALPVPVKLFLTIGLAGSVMTSVAFSLKKPAELAAADIFLVAASVIMGGGLWFFGQFFRLSDWESLFCLAAVCGALGLFFERNLRGKSIGTERYLVRLYYRGQEREFLALADSGNRLREPVTGKPVSVISYGDCENFCNRLSSVLYIPYRAVGTEQGMLPGIIFEKMEIVTGDECMKIEKPIVAVTRESLSKNGDFNMLLPEELIL